MSHAALVNGGLLLIVVLMTLLLMFLYTVIEALGRCRSRRSARAQHACACTARAGPRTAGQAATGPRVPRWRRRPVRRHRLSGQAYRCGGALDRAAGGL